MASVGDLDEAVVSRLITYIERVETEACAEYHGGDYSPLLWCDRVGHAEGSALLLLLRRRRGPDQHKDRLRGHGTKGSEGRHLEC